MRRIAIWLILGAFTLAGIWYLSNSRPLEINPPNNVAVSHVKANDQTILTTFLPKNPEASRIGLAAFDKFSDDYAMLFRSPAKTQVSLWMKNMKFDIDMVWLDAEGRVVHIHHDVSHKDQKTVYRAPRETNAQCVIELNAGASQKFGISLGDKLKFIDRDEPLCLDEKLD